MYIYKEIVRLDIFLHMYIHIYNFSFKLSDTKADQWRQWFSSVPSKFPLPSSGRVGGYKEGTISAGMNVALTTLQNTDTSDLFMIKTNWDCLKLTIPGVVPDLGKIPTFSRFELMRFFWAQTSLFLPELGPNVLHWC